MGGLESGIDMILRSFVRWLVGLEPKFGDIHFFRAMSRCSVECIVRDVADHLDVVRELRMCPFCGYRARNVGGIITHILGRHRFEISERIRMCIDVCR